MTVKEKQDFVFSFIKRLRASTEHYVNVNDFYNSQYIALLSVKFPLIPCC